MLSRGRKPATTSSHCTGRGRHWNSRKNVGRQRRRAIFDRFCAAAAGADAAPAGRPFRTNSGARYASKLSIRGCMAAQVRGALSWHRSSAQIWVEIGCNGPIPQMQCAPPRRSLPVQPRPCRVRIQVRPGKSGSLDLDSALVFSARMRAA